MIYYYVRKQKHHGILGILALVYGIFLALLTGSYISLKMG